MINILRMQEILKGVPEEALVQEMKSPTGAAPLFLVASRLQEVKKLKEQYALEQQQADTTVAEDLVGAQPGPPVARPVGGARPPATMSPPPPGTPLPAGPSPVAGLPPPSLPSPPPVRMESGGRIGYEKGGDININEAQFEKFLKLVQAEASDPETQRAVASVILNRLSVGQDFGNTLEEVMLKSGAFEPIGNIIKKKGKMDWGDLEAPSAITRDNIAKWFREGSQDPTDGALYFLNKALTDKRETTFPIFQNVDESQGLPEGTKRIGKMLFSKRWKADEDINRVEEALDTGKPTITVAGVETEAIPQPRDLPAELAAYSKAQQINIPSDAGAAVDEPQVTAQGHPITSWGAGIEKGFPGLGDHLASLTATSPTEIDREAEAEKYITGVTTGGPKFSAQGHLLSSGLGPNVGPQPFAYTPPPIPPDAVAASGDPAFIDAGYDVGKRRGGLSPYDIAGMLKGAQDQVGREDIQVAQDALRLQNYANQQGAFSEAVPGEDDDNQLAEASEMLIQQASNVPVQSDGGVSNQVAAYNPRPDDEAFGEGSAEDLIRGDIKEAKEELALDNALIQGAPDTLTAIPGGSEKQIAGLNVPMPEFYSNLINYGAAFPSDALRQQVEMSNLYFGKDGPPAPGVTRASLVSRPSSDPVVAQPDFPPAYLAQQAGHSDVSPASLTEHMAYKKAGLPADGGPVMTREDAVLAKGGGMHTASSGLPAPSAENQYLLDLEESMANAKGMGILMAGLGIMGQASKPGATLGSSLPGAAAGVKTYMDSSKDIRKTALEREKMRRLANYQQQSLASKPYQAMRGHMIDAYSRDPQLSKEYGELKDGKWLPNAKFENLVIQAAKGPDRSEQAKAARMTARVKWGASKSGRLAARKIKGDLEKLGITREHPRYDEETQKRMNAAFMADYGAGAGSGVGGENLSLEAIYNKE